VFKRDETKNVPSLTTGKSYTQGKNSIPFGTSQKKMLDFFGAETPIEKITADNAVAFRLDLQKRSTARQLLRSS
jgi:hypothetical protein